MEGTTFDFEQLANTWRALEQDVKNSKLSFETFYNAFSNTYKLLSASASEPCVEKKYLSIIVNASLFARAEVSENIDSKYKAALILTERMLDAVTAVDAADPSGESTVYILDLRQEIKINFKEVNDSIELLAKHFEAEYWKKLGR